MEPCFYPTLPVFRPDAGTRVKLPPQSRLSCLGLDAARPLCPFPVMLVSFVFLPPGHLETATHIENHILAHRP